MDNAQLTPNPNVTKEPVTMDFYAALREVANGKMVRRISWPEGDFALIVDFFLSIKINGEFKHWVISSDGDMSATDWVVCNG